MCESKKHVFWQALFLTCFFFILGLVFGVYLEQNRGDNFNTAFYQSEVSLYDSLALAKLSESNLTSCGEFRDSVIAFADKIYEESRELEKFDEKNSLTESLKTIHRKYDLLRTLLWINAIDAKGKCGQLNTVVYLYVYDTEDIGIKSEQVAWSRALSDLKQEQGNRIILIPIAVDSDLSTLDSLTKKFQIQDYPAVVINEKRVIYDIEQASEIKNYLE